MRNLFFLFCLISFSSLYGQALNRDSIVGEWVSREVQIPEMGESADKKAFVEGFKKGLANSKFIFGSNDVFTLVLAKDAPEFVNEFKFISNRKWSYDEVSKKIRIGTLQENLMEITIKQQDGIVLFLLEETPIILRMEKL